MVDTVELEPSKIDVWPWGQERIIWGYDPSHLYTLKLLEPKLGAQGCLSLQYHKHKSESWVVIRGMVWVVLADKDLVATRVMRQGDIQNLPAGMIHRMMGLSEDAQVLEPSTPDRHAADKNISKDVIRLDCLHGRAVSAASSPEQQLLVTRAVELTHQALDCLSRGQIPAEIGTQHLKALGAVKNLNQ